MAGTTARRVSKAQAESAISTTPVEEEVVTGVSFKPNGEKVHSRVYHGDDLGSIYIPRELLARLGTPDDLEITIRAKQ